MKQELHDIAVEAARVSPAALVSGVTLNHVVAGATLCYLLLQIAYLVRKWVREESAWGIRLKRWRDNVFTRPGDLEP